MARLIFVDIDETMISAQMRRGGELSITKRPGVDQFIRSLSGHGELYVLSHATRDHVLNALEVIGDSSRSFQGILSREDLKPVIDQLDIIFSEPGLSNLERDRLVMEIPPIAPRGVMFDDFPPKSEMYAIKATALGIDERHWIQVEAFNDLKPDRGGLGKAYQEYLRRFGRVGIAGGARRAAP
jgi:hypothetical protein